MSTNEKSQTMEVVMAEPTMREIRPVGREADGSVIWEDVDTESRWTAGEQPTDDELIELGESVPA